MSSAESTTSSSPERQALEKVLTASIIEHRRSRRWRIFFRFIYLIIFILILMALFSPAQTPINVNEPHVALIDIDGVISSDALTSSADNIMLALKEAYENDMTKAVILNINSPGGSAVESGRVYDEVMRLRKLYPDVKVYAVIDEMGTSAAYYIASAADSIYANRASVVGSIGVMFDSFGVVDAMKKIGVERRLITAGAHKGILDPFSPTNQQDIDFMTSLVDDVHTQFITAVKAGRGDRLSTEPDLFSGLFWTGDQAMKLGLVDGLGDAQYVAREIIGNEELVLYSAPVNLLDVFALRMGASFAQELTSRSGIQF